MQCTICAETITNPICPDCLTSRISSWLREVNPALAKKLKPFPIKTEDGEPCLFCGQKMNVCAHCVCYDLYEFLAEHDLKLAKEFAARFDFDLRKNLSA